LIPDPQPWRVLLVEDDEDDLVLTRGLFAASQRVVELVWVTNVEEALRRLAEPFDALLVDYRLGAVSGLELVREAVARGVAAPVILLTGTGSRELDVEAMQAGAADFLVKGELTGPLLERAVRYAIEHKRSEERLRRDVIERRAAESELLRRDAILAAVASVARRLLASGKWEERMPDVLATLGGAADVSRAFVFASERDEGGAVLASYRWEWVAAGIAARADDQGLKRFDYRANGFGRWLDELTAGRSIQGPLEQLHPEGGHPVFARLGVRSLALVPIMVAAEMWGVLGMHDCGRPREWSAAEVDALRAAADAIAAAIQRGEGAKALREREEQLRQAQKMEAVGRLAGGIAHDFNNLLTAISGYAELLLLRLPEGDPGRADCEEILRAAQRAAGLTRQLLAFSRRQVLQPRPVDLNRVVRDTERMLRRLIGEDIELLTELSPLPAAIVDPGKIEQVLVNLAVNARDAMPSGGRLRLATRVRRVGTRDDTGADPPLPSGSWVEVVVEDTGTGIPAEVLDKIFEPFFTTKEAGKGTGLGLSTAYGIVEQSGGTILVDSVLGRGTRFSLLLPASSERPGSDPGEQRAMALPASRAATILLVEDQEEVRRLVQTLLEGRGYRVLAAAEGTAAEALFDAHGADLLLADLVLPGLSGGELAQRLRRVAPRLPVLLMSGYPSSEVPGPGPLEGVALLQKPFVAADLLRRVDAALRGT
jgi:signal transduction histidine kinase/DNA-binding response OmpR family regulator